MTTMVEAEKRGFAGPHNYSTDRLKIANMTAAENGQNKAKHGRTHQF